MAEDKGPESGFIRIKITSPLAVVADMEAESALIPALLGNRLVIPKMAPFFCLIRPGKIRIQNHQGQDREFFVSQGVCEVRRDICAVMAWAQAVDKTDPVDITRLLEEAETMLANSVAASARRELMKRIDFYRLILQDRQNNI